MAKWDLSKLPEGRKPLPDEWFAERAQMQERIKGLEERLKAATDDAKEAEAYAGELEAVLESIKAKLAKAVEALEFYATQDVTYPNVGTVTFHGHDDNGCKARATLAELTGGKDE